MNEILHLATDERTARIALATTNDGEPDPMTWANVHSEGALEVLRFLVSDEPHESVAVETWRQELTRRLDAETIRTVIASTERLGLEVIIPGDPHWPAGLDDLREEAPLVLWERGDTSLLGASPTGLCAVVGSRASTDYGNRVASDLAAGLADRDRTVVSGGAYGIDAAAHRGALRAGGQTIAVLAGGLDRLYPKHNTELFERIAGQGLLLAEQPPGVVAGRRHFLSRNRITAALAGSMIVVEAADRSGALNAVTHAERLGRPVGATPGPLTSVASSGTNRMLRDGTARAVLDAQDVIDLAQPEPNPPEPPRPAPTVNQATPYSRHAAARPPHAPADAGLPNTSPARPPSSPSTRTGPASDGPAL